jgi:hypothetical protein
MARFFKRLLIILVVLFLLIQFYPRPDRNVSAAVSPQDIGSAYAVPADVQSILKTSCYDCHSNHTEYPWYSRIQPVSWWLGDHITEGKKKLNFSAFTGYSLRRQYHKLEEVEEMVNNGEMPFSSYTLMHNGAKLSETQKQRLVGWSASVRDSMRAKYPIDSLLRKKS